MVKEIQQGSWCKLFGSGGGSGSKTQGAPVREA